MVVVSFVYFVCLEHSVLWMSHSILQGFLSCLLCSIPRPGALGCRDTGLELVSSILCYAVLSHPHIRQAKNSCACRNILIELFCLAPYGSHLSLTRWPLVQMWLQCGCCLRLYSSLSLLWTKAKILSDLMNVYTLWLQNCHGTENEVDSQLLMTFWFLKYLLPTTVLNILI